MPTNSLIYIADDQADYRFVLQQLFTQYLPTYSVRFFEGGQALLDGLAESHNKPGLILLDRHMPRVDGQQTLRALKENPAYQLIPVVIMSSEASAAEINRGYQAGLNSFLKKGLDFQAMKQTMETVCHYWLETNQPPSQG